jgi:hypothetical protein
MEEHKPILGEDLAAAELLAHEVVEEVIERGAELLYDHYIEAKCVPYTVDFTLSLLADTFEMYYLRHDVGEADDWPEEREPQPCRIDTWARAAIPVKKKFKMAPPEEPTPQAADAKSMRSFRSSRSGLSRPGIRQKKTAGQFQTTQAIGEEGKPQLVALDIPQEEVSAEEEQLRIKKEKELKKKKDEQERVKKMQQEEEERQKKLQKRAEELKNKQFTYDHQGNIMLVQQPKFEKLPKTALEVIFKNQDAEREDSKQKSRGKSRGTVKEGGMAQAKAKKVPPPNEVEWVKNMTSIQPPLFENIKLANGVTFMDGGRVKYSNAAVAGEKKTMSRKEYMQTVNHSLNDPLANIRNNSQKELPKVQNFPAPQENTKSLQSSNRIILDELPDVFDGPSQVIVEEPRTVKNTPATDQARNKITVYNPEVLKTLQSSPNQLSAIDKFNLELMKSTTWGSNPPYRQPKLPERMPKKLSAADIMKIHGDKIKKPKDQPFMQKDELWQTQAQKLKRPRDRPFIEKMEKKKHKPPPPYGQALGAQEVFASVNGGSQD